MAIIVLATEAVAFVHRSDPDAVVPEGHDDAWLLARGQPEGATRVVARPLSRAEMDSIAGSTDDASTLAGYWQAVESIGGERLAIEQVTPALQAEIIRLIASLTTGSLGPFGR